MYVNQKQFLIITLLFTLLPLSVNWRMLVFGIKTTGKAIGYVDHFNTFDTTLRYQDEYTLITFFSNKGIVEFTTQENVIYPIGHEVPIFYNKRNPEKYLMANFDGMALNNKMIIPYVFLILWFAFYLSFNKKPPRKKKHFDFDTYRRRLKN